MFAGDFAVGQTVDLKFTTRRFTTGAPFTLAGTPAVAAYPDNSVTQITAGITLSVDFDALTGLNNVRVVATAGNGYAAGTSYALVITAGTVDSVSVVGEVVGSFTLERGAAFGRLGAPAGASVSADVAAVKVDTAAILVDTGTTLDGRIPAALVGGRIDASVGAMAANVMTAAAAAADLTTELQSGLATAAALDTVDNFLDTEIAAILAAVDTEVAAIITTLGTPAGVSVSADIAAIEAQTDDIGVAGAGLTALGDARIANLDAAVTTRATPAQVNTEVVDALNVDTYAEPGLGAPAATNTLVAKIGYLFKAWRNRTTQTATTYTLFADDATTANQTATVSDDGTTFDRTEIA